MAPQRTYWHLASSERKPSEYDIGSSELLYHTRLGFAVRTPVVDFCQRQQSRAGLQCADWERFRDPRATTYASYVATQRDQEVLLDTLSSSAQGRDERPPQDWIEVLDEVLGTLCYPVHGLQMIAAYVGSVAPSGKIVIASLFQAGDEVRRAQRLARRVAELRALHPRLGERSRASWQSTPHWQPLRELIERLLVVYDFGQALAVLDGLIKPCFDGLFVSDFAELARDARDDGLQKLLQSLHQDCAWHSQWSRALLRMVVRESERNRRLVAGWLALWRPLVSAALVPLIAVLSPSDASTRAALEQRLDARLREHESWLELPPEALEGGLVP